MKPEYADERADDFFSRGFVGSSHGDNGTAYSTHWSPMHPDLFATKVYKGRHSSVCAYCGNPPMPIQVRRSSSDWPVIGYTCCCTGAMDEREYVVKVAALDERHNDERHELEATAPKVSEQVLIGLIENDAKKAVARLKGGWSHTMADTGVKLVRGEQ